MARKRPDGDGLVRKRKDGRWEGRIVIGHKEDGTPIYKSVFAKTQKELMPKLHGAIDCYRDADLSEQGNMTLNEWIEQWLASYAEPTLRESTVRGYRSDIRRHIDPALGNKMLRSITRRDVQKFYNALGRKKYKASDGSERCLADATVRGVHMLLHEIMEAAVRSRLIVQNPTDGTVIPKLNRPPMKILNEEQLDRFMEAIRAEPLWYDFFYTELTTGLRRGEICGLRWQDFDEKIGVLHVRRTLHMEDGRLVAGATKTGCGTRDIVLPDGTAEILRKRKSGSYSEWIFPNLTKPDLSISPGAAYLRLKEILKRSNLPDIRFHDLRHTFITTSLEHGMDVKTLSAIVGHVSAAITLDVYSHVTMDMQKNAAAKIDRGIAKNKEQKPKKEAVPPPMTDFTAQKGSRRRPGTGCVTRIDEHLWEGRYTPTYPDGKRHPRNVYAHSEEACEAKLKRLIAEMKAEIAALKAREKWRTA